ncbi:CG0192-related protein [Kineococcus sp. SYSU DK001]|uniref:CG0192-related protein n=1 Tax=Kineococcus sp. SYSU DK001 TaxID=3383122 RepID=UPI003D7DE818
MAVIHNAQLSPSKLDAITGWLPSQPWSGFTPGDEAVVAGRFRFDDPAGEVGVETILVRTGGRVLHVPLTYRGAPLAGAGEFLITEMDHSVLGRRWVYDATGDPVYADTLRRTIATGGSEADVQNAVDGRLETGTKEGFATGSGADPDSPAVTAVTTSTEGAVTTIGTGHGTLHVLRVVGTTAPAAGETLTGRWADDEPAVLAVLTAP